jgi:uncharacterized protein (TIGR02145 family)
MLMLLIYSVNITAQVTIGSDQPPRAGAGLDLRSSDKGLLLPNVSLSDPATDFQLDGGEGATAAGMVVYNTSAELAGPGVYVWDGSRWILITCVPETPGTIDLSPTTVNLNGTFTASVPEVTGPAAPTAYAWALPDGLTGTSTTRSITITGATAGTYNSGMIKVTATNACGTSAERTSAKAVTVRDCSAAPTISLPATDETKITKQGVALPADLSITAEENGTSADYQWQSSTDLLTWTLIAGAPDAATFTAPVANAGTTYYRCVVTTGCGHATSNIFTVNVCGTAIQDDEGNWYCTGDFGTAGTWMTMNLRSTTGLTENGNAGTDTSNKYYWYPGQDSDVSATTADDILDAHPEYGLSYTWAAATGRTDVTDNEENNSGQTQYQGICPAGWHLPSDYEWTQLTDLISASADGAYSTTTGTGNIGMKMKSTTPVDGATNGTSNSRTANGFDALLVGDVYNGSPHDYGTNTYFWSSSSGSSTAAWCRILGGSSTGVFRINNYGKYYMFSVRCKKDECSAAPTILSPATDETRITKTGEAVSDLSVTAEGKGVTPTFQWESSADRSTWNPIESATAAAYTAPVNVAGTTYYRCVVTTGCGDVTSKIFTVNVCGTSIQDDEGNWYCTGDFGDAGTWMTMNLRSTTDLTENGDSETDVFSKYYWYPGQDSDVSATTADDILDAHPEYGLLYTWAAATGRTGISDNEANNSGQTQYPGICPSGWHLPSDYEWNQLEEVIAKSDANVYSTTGATTWESGYSTTNSGYRGAHGRKMKSRTAVTTQATNGTSNGLAANGFDALLVGYMTSGSPGSYGMTTYFWSSSSESSLFAWRRILIHNNTGVGRSNGGKYNMSSVRCKKN